jgi:hypothetical protein
MINELRIRKAGDVAKLRKMHLQLTIAAGSVSFSAGNMAY